MEADRRRGRAHQRPAVHQRNRVERRLPRGHIRSADRQRPVDGSRHGRQPPTCSSCHDLGSREERASCRRVSDGRLVGLGGNRPGVARQFGEARGSDSEVVFARRRGESSLFPPLPERRRALAVRFAHALSLAVELRLLVCDVLRGSRERRQRAGPSWCWWPPSCGHRLLCHAGTPHGAARCPEAALGC
jgi:hypothetical protein